MTRFLPLAIDLAGAYIYSCNLTLVEFLPKYEENVQEVMGRLPLGACRYDWTIFTMWEMSFQAIIKQNKVAADLLLLFGPFSNNVWEELFLCGWVPANVGA